MKHKNKLNAIARCLFKYGETETDALLERVNRENRHITLTKNELIPLLYRYFKHNTTHEKTVPETWGLKDYSLLSRYQGDKLFKHGKVARSGKTVWCNKDGGRHSFDHCLNECQDCEGAF